MEGATAGLPTEETMSSTMRKATRVVAALAALLAAVSCDAADPVGPTPSPVVERVTLDADAFALSEGETRQVIATPRDAAGNALAGRAVSWGTSDPDVVTVGPTGVMTAIRVGVARVTATSEGRSAEATVEVGADRDFELLYTMRTFDIFHEAFRLDVDRPGAAAARIFADAQWAWQARPSPDGRRVAYVCPNPISGDPSICVAERDGRDAALVGAFIGEAFTDPTWSPDGERIAYVRTKFDGVADRSHIGVMNADGSGQLALTAEMPGEQQMPAWSPELPDGTQRIAFVQDAATAARIVTMRPDGGDVRVLTGAGAHDLQPAWSPDGRQLAFQRTTATVNGDLWLMRSDGSDARPLIPFVTLAGAQLSPTWSPDGRLVAFTSGHASAAGTTQVFTVWADGSKLVQRTFDVGHKASPAWIRRVP